MRLVAVIGAMLVLAQSSAAAATPNPCALLTSAEVAKAIGSKVAMRQEIHNQGFGRTCQWQGVNLAGHIAFGVHREVSLIVNPSKRSQFLGMATENNGVRIAGIGDLAFLLPIGEGGLMNVYARGYWLELNVSNVTSGVSAEKRLAKAAVARL